MRPGIESERSPGYFVSSIRGGYRVLLPSGHRHAAARALMAFTTGQPRIERVHATVLGLSFAAGLGPLAAEGEVRLAPPHGLERMLADVLRRDLVLAVRTGGTGSDRKPVALLLTPLGGAVGYAKFAVDEHTARLVRSETETLRSLRHCHLPDVTVPRVLHAGSWRGMPFLVQEALPVGEQTDPPTRHRLLRATIQIANTAGVVQQPLAASEYLHRLTRAVKELPGGALGDALRAQLTRLPDVNLLFGAWHGDLTRWNMSSTQRRDFVWDWERAEVCAPLGFDALHYNLRECLRANPRTGVDTWLRSGARLLDDPAFARSGVTPTSRTVATTMALYLTDRTTRRLREDPSWSPRPWLMPILRNLVGRANGTRR
ncbi:aminoglycoside phosphotransferase [Spiractinospora alimapuensis]|uniref:aminoglycoside phosphotransferase family protein n=1 Tax=Spiractinospora alimapuensis TaxID=2820884 RepID=UPI001F1AFB13|nr:aminoglycoside phosphotransferase family protein [Spiractinospora alimapuensis]QVQ51408.1 aminoglycoside phosphotransferase [Spiractinospora alimapuensis]